MSIFKKKKKDFKIMTLMKRKTEKLASQSVKFKKKFLINLKN